MKSSWRIAIGQIRRAGGLVVAGALACAGGTSVAATIAAAPAQVNPGNNYSPGVADVLKLVEAKVDPEVIKAFIKNSNVFYSPNASEIILLKDRGVPADVITTMIQQGAEVRAQATRGYSVPAPGNQAGTAGGPTVVSPPTTYVPAPDYGYSYPDYYNSYTYYPSYVYPYTFSYAYDYWPYWPTYSFSWNYPYYRYWGWHYPYYGHYPYRDYGHYPYHHYGGSFAYRRPFGSGAWAPNRSIAVTRGGSNIGLHSPYGYGAPVTGRSYSSMAARSPSFGGRSTIGSSSRFGGGFGGSHFGGSHFSGGHSGGFGGRAGGGFGGRR